MVVAAFSSLARIWGECSAIHSPPSLFFFFKVELSSRTLIPLLCQDQSTVAQQAETTITFKLLAGCLSLHLHGSFLAY